MLSEHRYVRAQQPQCHRPLHFRHTVGNQQAWQCLKIIARVKEYKTEAFGQHLSGFILELRRAASYFTINTRFGPNKQMKGTFMAFIMLNCQILDGSSLSKAAIFLELVFSYDVIFSNTLQTEHLLKPNHLITWLPHNIYFYFRFWILCDNPGCTRVYVTFGMKRRPSDWEMVMLHNALQKPSPLLICLHPVSMKVKVSKKVSKYFIYSFNSLLFSLFLRFLFWCIVVISFTLQLLQTATINTEVRHFNESVCWLIS